MSDAEIASIPGTHNPRKAFAFAFLASLFISLAQYYFKISSHSGGSGGALEILVRPALYLGLGFYLLSFYWTMRAYQWEGISFVLPVVTLCDVWNVLLAHFSLGEAVTPTRIVGIAIILLGIFVLTR